MESGSSTGEQRPGKLAESVLSTAVGESFFATALHTRFPYDRDTFQLVR